MTCQFGNALKSYGVKKGDRVAIYMPMSPLAVTAMLACARIGAVHSVVFTGFSAEALRERIIDCQCEIVVTADQGARGGKTLELKKIVNEAVEGLDFVRHIFFMKRTGGPYPSTPKDVSLEEAMSKEPKECAPEVMDSEDTLFLLYTSGSTGKPKGIVHTQAGYILYASMTHQFVFDYQSGDVYACVADVGWITGHSYVVYGPLCNGATTVLFESSPVYPDAGRYWEMVQRLKLNQLYTAPTAIRMLYQHGDAFVTKYDRSTLRVLGSVGEPLNADAWQWYFDVVGDKKCTIVDTWWQTETGGIMITPRPAPEGLELKPAFPMIPFFGVEPCLMDNEGKELIGNEVEGNLCVKKPTPGMARGIYGNRERFMGAYFNPFPGCYFSGDGAYRDKDGHYKISGRVDDVINVKGHRLGTAEIESAMNDDNRVAETAVIGYHHDMYGQAIYAYVILRRDVEDDESSIVTDLVHRVRSKIGSLAVPERFLVGFFFVWWKLSHAFNTNIHVYPVFWNVLFGTAEPLVSEQLQAERCLYYETCP
jgi:acetyl-CoA synthetase